MTDRFEVLDRDGAARIGELRFEPPVATPAIADEIVEDAGSRWPGDPPPPEGGDDRLTVLPHRGLPGGTDERVQAAYAPSAVDVPFPSAVVVTPATADDYGADAYVLSTAQSIVGHGSAFADAIVATREAIPPDTALYLSGVATPRNIATLVYAGVDLVDTDRAVIAGTRRRYLTATDDYDLDRLTELPCACPACRRSLEAFTVDDCIDHNVNALEAALSTVRQRVRDGRLRDYIEGQARHAQWCTAAYRELDSEWGYLERRTPVARRAEISAASEDTMHRVEIRRFADRVSARYRNRFDAPTVLVPCSARKPYSSSQSHEQFRDAIAWRGHVVSMTSPIGVVPAELELTYPAQHYDAVVTGRWSAGEIEFVAAVLERYLEANPSPRVIAHVPDEGYRAVCERVEAALGMDFEYTVDDHPTADESLSALRGALDGEAAYRKREREHNTVRAIADYQFGEGIGDVLFDGIEVRGRYPKHRVFAEGEQLATLVPQYGLLALTIAGARRLETLADAPTVAIEAFVPHGSVLAPGVVDADAGIREGDEVIVSGPAAFGVGRAVMHGREMRRSERGIAVDVRHVDER